MNSRNVVFFWHLVRFSFYLSLAFTAIISLVAQEKNTSKIDPVYEFWKNEKLIIPFEKIHTILEQNQKNNLIPNNEKVKKDALLGQNEVEVSNDTAPESELHAVINPTDSNNIVISPIRQDRYNPMEPLLCPLYYTNDFGKTWNKSTFKNLPQMANSFVLGGGDPVLGFDTKGKLYFSWINLFAHVVGLNPDSIYAAIYWAYSTNGGADWNRESNDAIKILSTHYSGYFNLTGMYDKQWMAVDRSNSPYQDNLYASMTYVGSNYGSPFYTIFLAKKEANSKVFSPDTVLISSGTYTFVQFSSIDVDNTGKIHVTFVGYKMSSGKTSLYYSNSSDGGKTFSSEIKLSDIILLGAKMIPGSDLTDSIPGILTDRLYPCSQLAIDKSNKSSSGNLYSVWTANGREQTLNNGSDIYFTRSTDGGLNWSDPIIINDNISGVKNEQYYPAITVNENGVLIISWYDRRMDVQNNLNTQIYMVYSFDGGKTFTRNFPVTSIPTNFSTVGLNNGGFGIGEYTSVVSTKGYAIPVWTDGRTNDGNLNIYAAFVPITENPVTSTFEKIVNVNNGIELNDPVPNPANNSFLLSYKIPKTSRINLSVIDISGKVLKEVLNSLCEPGEYNVNINSSELIEGIYFCRLETDYGYSIKKIIISR